MGLTTDRAGWVDRLDELHLLTPARIVLIVGTACLLAVIVRRMVERLVGRVVGLGPMRSGDRTSPRSRSLSGAIRSLALVAIWSIAVIAAMNEVGVNVGGVLFTATVIGGALAFGAQTLVRDLIAGMFVLAEDQYGVGDVIDVGPLAGGSAPVTGTVERISLRATRVRDGDGRVWHVPNGAVVRVANLSLRSVAVLELHVDRSMTLDALQRAADALCRAITEHPVAGPLCVEAPSYAGVADLRDDRMVGKVSVRTQPGRHDDVKRIWRELSIDAYQSGALRVPAADRTALKSWGVGKRGLAGVRRGPLPHGHCAAGRSRGVDQVARVSLK